MIEKAFKTDKGTIHYMTGKGPEGSHTLVFLPGLTADRRLFEKQIEYFEGRYNVLVWDAPGHYGSRPFKLEFSLADKARWLHDILREEGIKMPVFIGQSMGGYVSQCYLELFPGETKGFMSIDSAPLKRKYMTAIEVWMLKHTETMYRAYPWNALIKSGSKGCAETEYGRELMVTIMNTYEKDEYCKLVSHGYRILGEAVETNLPYEPDCPVLLICGDHDKAGSTKRYNVNWSKGENYPIKWIAGAGHNSNTDAPEEVNAIIEEFVSGLII